MRFNALLELDVDELRCLLGVFIMLFWKDAFKTAAVKTPVCDLLIVLLFDDCSLDFC